MEDNNVERRATEEQNRRIAEADRRDAAQWKKTKGVFGGVFRIIFWCVIIVIVVFLTLYLSARIAGFNSIADMLRFIFGHF